MSVVSRVVTLADLRAFTAWEAWPAGETELERALEGWIEAIAKEDARAGVLAATACAERALPVVEANAVASPLDFGGPRQEWGGCTPPVAQLAAVRAWLSAGTEIPRLTADYGRQLNVWEDDLRPTEDARDWFVYFVEATNLLVMAVLHDDQGGPYDTWRRSLCAARSAVCSYKAMHRAGDDREADLQELVSAVRAALGA